MATLLAQVIKALIDLKIIVPTADMFSIRRSLDYFLKNFQQATQREETIAVRMPQAQHRLLWDASDVHARRQCGDPM